MTVSVKVMLSYDYNHFEIALSDDSLNSDMRQDDYANHLRKRAQRLADEAVRQYKKAKEMAINRLHREGERARLIHEVEMLRQRMPESEWSAEDRAKVKALDDADYWDGYQYDYDDDFTEE